MSLPAKFFFTSYLHFDIFFCVFFVHARIHIENSPSGQLIRFLCCTWHWCPPPSPGETPPLLPLLLPQTRARASFSECGTSPEKLSLFLYLSLDGSIAAIVGRRRRVCTPINIRLMATDWIRFIVPATWNRIGWLICSAKLTETVLVYVVTDRRNLIIIIIILLTDWIRFQAYKKLFYVIRIERRRCTPTDGVNVNFFRNVTPKRKLQ